MFPSQMVHLKIVEPSSGSLFPCFPRKWYAIKIVETLKWVTFSMFPSQMVHLKTDEHSSGLLFPCFPRKWYALKLSNPQLAHFFRGSPANGAP